VTASERIRRERERREGSAGQPLATGAQDATGAAGPTDSFTLTRETSFLVPRDWFRMAEPRPGGPRLTWA
jgi:hypothetical protein